MDAVADKTGVPYDFEPIIQLQRYQNVIVEILSFLLDSGAPAEVVNRMTDAKFNWLDMMNRIYTMQELQWFNESMLSMQPEMPSQSETTS